MDESYNLFMRKLLEFTDESEAIQWVNFFKNDSRALLWLSKKAAASYLPCGSLVPENFDEATALIERYNEYLKDCNLELYKSKVFNIMKEYLSEILPVRDFQWLKKTDDQGLYWVWVYLHFNKPVENYLSQVNNIKPKNFISTADEIFPLILHKLDNTVHNGYRESYLSILLKKYSSFVIKRNPVYWLDPKDKEGCSWVWQYIIKKYKHLDFLAPITNRDIYLAIVAVISNWDLLHENPQSAIYEKAYDRYIPNVAYTPGPPYAPYAPNAAYTPGPTYAPHVPNVAYTPGPPFAHLTTYFTQAVNNSQQSHRSNNSRPPVFDCQDINEQETGTDECNTVITKDMLLKQLYNGYKQRKHRERNENTLNLTKANQKKLTNYAKDQNTTEKKALNEIVKTMLD